MSTVGMHASQAFNPTKLANLGLWLDATDFNTITKDGSDLVSGWADKSTHENDASQATPTNQPLYVASSINGIPAIEFNGSDNYMHRSTFTQGVLSQPNTIFIVWELITLPSAIGKIIDGGGVDRLVVEINELNEWQMWAGDFLIGSLRAINTPYVSSSYFNTTTSEGFINGVSDMTGDVSTMDINGITIGARFNAIQFLNVKVGEIIVYDALLTTSERQQVEDYLQDKWDI